MGGSGWGRKGDGKEGRPEFDWFVLDAWNGNNMAA